MGRVKELISDDQWEAWEREGPDEPYAPEEQLYAIVKTLARDEDIGCTCIVFADNVDEYIALKTLRDIYAGNHPTFFNSVDVWVGSDIEIIPIVSCRFG